MDVGFEHMASVGLILMQAHIPCSPFKWPRFTIGLDLANLSGGEAGGGLDRDVVIGELHVDVTKFDGDKGQRDQRDRIMGRRLKGRKVEENTLSGDICYGEKSAVWYKEEEWGEKKHTGVLG